MKNNKNQAQMVDFLLKVSRKLRVLYDKRIREHGLTLARARTLMALKDQDNFYQKNLAEELEIENATLVRLIDALEAQGLVMRDAVAGDRRAKNITLTEEGRNMVVKIEEFSQNIRAEIMLGISKSDLDTSISVLSRMADMIEEGGRS